MVEDDESTSTEKEFFDTLKRVVKGVEREMKEKNGVKFLGSFDEELDVDSGKKFLTE